MIQFKQINGNLIDLSASKLFVEHYNKPNSFSSYIIDKEINAGMYDEPLFNEMFTNNPIVIDAGANVGLFTLYVLPKIGFVHCIEPTNTHFEVLRDIVDIFSNRAKYHNLALSNYDGTAFFDVVERNTTENKISSKNEGMEVDCLTLKSFFNYNNLTEVDVLKLDIEGGEQKVLMEDDTVDECLVKCKMVYVETHPYPYGDINEQELINKMTRLNFSHATGNRTFSHYFKNNR